MKFDVDRSGDIRLMQWLAAVLRNLDWGLMPTDVECEALLAAFDAGGDPDEASVAFSAGRLHEYVETLAKP